MRFVASTVKTEHLRAPNRPIYLVGESLGACIALAVAACNPEIDLALILANPGSTDTGTDHCERRTKQLDLLSAQSVMCSHFFWKISVGTTKSVAIVHDDARAARFQHALFRSFTVRSTFF